MTPHRHHASDTGDGLMGAILDHPFDLRPRLILADWLEVDAPEGERDAARAELIRLMCDGVSPPMELWHGVFPDGFEFQPKTGEINVGDSVGWFEATDGYGPAFDLPRGLVRNGFVEEVRCPLAFWLGGECERCLRDAGGTAAAIVNCPACHGTGRTPAHGPEVVARHPVTTVRVTDREPYEGMHTGGESWQWYDGDHPNGLGVHPPSDLPAPVFARLTKYSGSSEREKNYPTRQAAESALSRALVDLAREAAGLPPIPWEVMK